MPCARANSAIAARLCSKASSSSSRAGVGTSSRSSPRSSRIGLPVSELRRPSMVAQNNAQMRGPGDQESVPSSAETTVEQAGQTTARPRLGSVDVKLTLTRSMRMTRRLEMVDSQAGQTTADSS